MQSDKSAAPAEKDLLGKITDALLEGTVGGLIINFLIIPFLCLAIILLPPVSAAQRILDINYNIIDQDGGAVRDPDGMQVTFLPEGINRQIKVRLTSEPRTTFLEGSAGKELLAAAEAIPANLIMKSPLYRLDVKGEEPTAIVLTIPIPNDSEPYRTLDLYDWTGEEWRWLSSHVIEEDELIESDLEYAPHNIAVMQTKPLALSVAADISAGATLPAEGKDTLVQINPQGLMLDADGTIGGDLGALPEADQTASYVIVPTLRNWGPDGVVRSDYIDNMLVNEETRRRHIEEIVDLTVRNVYPGIDIYYKGINPDLRPEFTLFIKELALALHTNQKQLSVRVEVPMRVAADRWETGVYDWRAIGEAADAVKIPAMADPRAYRPDGDMDAFLKWAVGEINRYKLQLLISTRSIEQVGDTWAEIPYEQALQPLSQVRIEGDKAVVAPGEQIVFTLANLAQSSGVQFDDPSGTYWFTYTDRGGQERTIYLENAASIARKLQLVAQYNLRGVAVQNLLGEENDAQIWEVIRKFHDLIVPPVQSQFAVIWKVQSASGGTLSETSAPLDDPRLVWTAPEEGGEFKVAASISSNGQATGAGGEVAVMVATPTPLPTPTPVPTPTPELPPTPVPKAAEAPAEEAPAEEAPPAPASSSVADTGANPNLVYGAQSHLFEGVPGQKAMAVRNMGFQALKQQIRWCDLEGAKGAVDLSQVDRIVNEVSGQGINLMFSVVCPPGWAQGAHGLPANYDDYANFVSTLATRYDGKVLYYEIWNEQNLKRGAEEIVPPDAYVAFLKHVYTKVKAANPNVIVLSGAPTPAGNVAGWAIDDIEYLQQMYAAGLKDACDGVGAHPSGYNVPPDADWQTWSDPGARFRGPSDNHHHSWVFRGTMEGYRAVMVANGDGGKKIWPTEFGWASNPSPVAGYEYSADNSEAEQAEYFVKAYQMMRNWPWVGGAFLWNLDFNVFKPGSEEAAFGIYGRPAYSALSQCRANGSC
jgi:spore germination protein YaaH